MRQFDRSSVRGLILVLLGVALLAQNAFHLDDVFGPAVLIVIGIALIGYWTQTKRLGLLIGGSVTSCLGAYALMDNIVDLRRLSGSLFFLFQAAAFYAIHRLADEKPQWALYTAAGLTAFSVFVLAADGFGIASDFVAPIMIVLFGILLIVRR